MLVTEGARKGRCWEDRACESQAIFLIPFARKRASRIQKLLPLKDKGASRRPCVEANELLEEVGLEFS